MRPVRVVKQGNTLVAATPAETGKLLAIPDGTVLTADLSDDRDLTHHNWYWALLAVVAEATGLHIQALHSDLRWRVGLVDAMFQSGGVTLASLTPTRFPRRGGSLLEHEFRAYVDIAIEIIFRDYLPGVRRQDVFKEVERMVGHRP